MIMSGEVRTMANQTKSQWEQAIEDTAVKAETEVRRVIAYLNDEVVPEVRRDGSRALRTAANELVKLAERMEGRRPAAGSGSYDRR